MHMKRQLVAVSTAVFLGLTAAAAPAAAQAPGLELVPKFGAYLPINDLAEVRPAVEDIHADMEASLGLGLALEVDLPGSPLDFRANMEYATGTEVSADGFSEDEAVESTVLTLVGDVVFRPLPTPVIQPYLLAGAGFKRYDFEFEDADPSDLSNLFRDSENDFTLHVGAGVDIGLGPLALLVEAGDYISWYAPEGSDQDSEMQNDIFLMAGFRVGLL